MHIRKYSVENECQPLVYIEYLGHNFCSTVVLLDRNAISSIHMKIILESLMVIRLRFNRKRRIGMEDNFLYFFLSDG